MKPHRTDVFSLLFGLLFLAVVTWWGTGRVLPLALPGLGWFLAGALIVFGVAGLLGALRPDGRRRDRDADGDPL